MAASAAGERGTIEVVAHASLLLSMLLFARWRAMSIEIDGELGRFRWGTHAFSVAAGPHTVVVGLGWWRASSASISIEVAANETVRLRYTPHALKHVAGRLDIERLPHARATRR